MGNLVRVRIKISQLFQIIVKNNISFNITATLSHVPSLFLDYIVESKLILLSPWICFPIVLKECLDWRQLSLFYSDFLRSKWRFSRYLSPFGLIWCANSRQLCHWPTWPSFVALTVSVTCEFYTCQPSCELLSHDFYVLMLVKLFEPWMLAPLTPASWVSCQLLCI